MKSKITFFGLFLFATITLFAKDIKVGAEQTVEYLPLLKNKRVGIVTNQTGLIGHVHVVDSLLNAKVNLQKIYCPEHGFRGEVEAGGIVNSSKDEKTGLPIISLYGSHKKPKPEDLEGVDIVIFDIQDVGARFYTYISTLHYVMEACAEQGKEVIVLDRPNPNGFYVDGPVLDMKYKSFIGMHPVPIVYGMTIGEYGQMINGEGWLANGVKCKLTVIKNKNYTHESVYEFSMRPSPNLRSMNAIYLYPSLCLFEGTIVSIGRGTYQPFECVGHPDYKGGSFSFIPVPLKGYSEDPPLKNQVCRGYDLSIGEHRKPQLDLSYMLDMYQNLNKKDSFFTSFFEKVAGTASLRKQIEDGLTEDEIRTSWQSDLEQFKAIRKKYLLYK